MIPFYIGGYWTIPVLPIDSDLYKKKWNKPLAMIQAFLIPFAVGPFYVIFKLIHSTLSFSYFFINTTNHQYYLLNDGSLHSFYLVFCALWYLSPLILMNHHFIGRFSLALDFSVECFGFRLKQMRF